MTAPLLVIAAGGTGGHMFPAQALAEEMLGRGWRVELTTDERGMRYAGGFPEAVTRVELSSATFSRGGLLAKLKAPFAIHRGIADARARFAADKPACVAGFGGYPALPALAGAVLMRLPRIIHEQNGVLGRVNRMFASRVDMVCCGTWPVTNPPGHAKLRHVGNPVRAAAKALAGAPYQGPSDGPIRLLVFGGSQGAAVFARLLPQAIAMLPEELRACISLTQQVRDGEAAQVADTYTRAGVDAEVATFFDDLPRRIADSHLVVARAGASSLAEITAIGRPSILVPYPHAMDDHQSANAAALKEASAAIVAPEAHLTAESLSQHLRDLLAGAEGDAHLTRMAVAAKALGRPQAAQDLGDIVQALGLGDTR